MRTQEHPNSRPSRPAEKTKLHIFTIFLAEKYLPFISQTFDTAAGVAQHCPTKTGVPTFRWLHSTLAPSSTSCEDRASSWPTLLASVTWNVNFEWNSAKSYDQTPSDGVSPRVLHPSAGASSNEPDGSSQTGREAGDQRRRFCRVTA